MNDETQWLKTSLGPSGLEEFNHRQGQCQTPNFIQRWLWNTNFHEETVEFPMFFFFQKQIREQFEVLVVGVQTESSAATLPRHE